MSVVVNYVAPNMAERALSVLGGAEVHRSRVKLEYSPNSSRGVDES